MALIIEDGSIVAESNSYVSVDDLMDYLELRGLSLSDESKATSLIIKAMDYVESKDYLGSRASDNQALKFPRKGITLDGVEVDDSTIPALVKKAVCQLAYDADSQDLLSTSDGKVVIRERVEGAVDVSYDGNLSSNQAIFAQAESFLSKFYSFGSTGMLKVYRA